MKKSKNWKNEKMKKQNKKKKRKNKKMAPPFGCKCLGAPFWVQMSRRPLNENKIKHEKNTGKN